MSFDVTPTQAVIHPVAPGVPVNQALILITSPYLAPHLQYFNATSVWGA
jgi:hypothetical protein